LDPNYASRLNPITNPGMPDVADAAQGGPSASVAPTMGQKVGGIFSGNGAGNGFSISPATAAIQAGSNLVGGLGQGIMQKQATQDEINAAQWAQKSFIGAPGKAVASAAGAPTTVPNGYLSRAAALRNMLGQPNNTPPGVSPPTTGLPPTMSAVPPGGGPVPIAGMNATPAGGVI
jgi:hypothetical protein